MGLVQVISQISTLILAMFLSRYLGVEYTTYTSAFSVATVLFIIADFGMGFQMVVEVAPNKSIAPRYLSNVLFLRGVLGGLALLLTVALILIEQLPPTVAFAYLIIAISTIFNWLAQTFASMYTAYERMYYVLMTSLVERMFTVSVSIGMVLVGFGLDLIVLVVLAGSVLNVTLSYLVCSHFIVRPARGFDIKGAREQLRNGIPYALNSALISSLYALNGFLLLTIVMGQNGLAAGELANTEFYIAFNLVVSLVAVPTVLRTALLPVVSRLYGTSTELTRLTQQKVMKYMFALGLPITVGGFVLADQLILLLFPNYPPAATVFRALIPVIAISFLGTGIGSLLASANLMRLNTVSAVTGAVLNIVLCFVLIPLIGPVGAALAFTSATLATNVISYHYMAKRLFKLDLADVLIRPTCAATGMATVLLVLPRMDFLPSLAIGAVTYFVLLFAFRAISAEDTAIFRKVLNKGA